MPVNKEMRILVVDDYQTMIRILRNLLRQLGFEKVDEASDGSSALAKLRRSEFDLVISDWNMEPMTGIQLLREMRSDDKLMHLPFIMVTAEAQSENIMAAREAGASDYIIKPFNADILKAKMVNVFGEF